MSAPCQPEHVVLPPAWRRPEHPVPRLPTFAPCRLLSPVGKLRALDGQDALELRATRGERPPARTTTCVASAGGDRFDGGTGANAYTDFRASEGDVEPAETRMRAPDPLQR